MKVLIADDNAQNRYLLEQILRSTGHTCESAANGSEGLALARAQPFDAIVSDILMPVMDGFQFCREVKSDPALAPIPFVFYTATYTEPADVEFGRSLGAADYLLKPAEPDVILASLGRLHASAQPVAPATAGPEDYLQQYNARLIHKLESKMAELERANADLLRTNLALGDEINRRRNAETQARAALELQQATLESTADGVLAVDADGRVVAWNRRCPETWGLPPDAAPPARFGDVLALLCGQLVEPAAGRAEWEARAAAEPTEQVDELRLRGERACERLSRRLAAPDGRAGRVWTFRDITERRRIEDSRRALQNQLIQLQKMEALGVLAGGIAHDFNNLLTAILGQSTIAATSLPAQHPLQPPLSEVRKAALRGAELVRQILTFSRHEEPERRVLKLDVVVREAIKFMRSMLPAGVALEVDLAPEVPMVRADSTQLHQVLMNLATNAAQAMNGQGRVVVRLRAVHLEEGSSPGNRAGDYAELSVRDNGPGIDQRVRHRIFEPFFTTKPPGQGTGLGLAVVHGIVTGHGGHLVVRSEPGAGAEFQIYLPAATGAKESAPADASRIMPGRGETVMLVEDDDAVRASVALLLERVGYRAIAFASANEALAGFAEPPAAFAAVLTDLSMPGRSGTQLAREIRRRRPDFPLVIMTGYVPTEELDAERAALQFELLLKPCTAESLSAALFRALRLGR